MSFCYSFFNGNFKNGKTLDRRKKRIRKGYFTMLLEEEE